jgi:hypothetical protein
MEALKRFVLLSLLSFNLTSCSVEVDYCYDSYTEYAKDKFDKGPRDPNIIIEGSKNICGWYHTEMPMAAVEYEVDQRKIALLLQIFNGQDIPAYIALDEWNSFRWKKNLCDASCIFKKRIDSGVGYDEEYLAINKAKNYVYYWGQISREQ